MKLAQNAILLSRLIQDQENASLVKICSVRTFFLELQAHDGNEGDCGPIWVLTNIIEHH